MGASLVAARMLPKHKKSYQEILDIWDLYCMTYYYRNCGGDNVKMQPPEPSAFEERYQEVHSCVTEQLTEMFTILKNSMNRKNKDEFASPFILTIEESSIDHPEAGKGVFLNGSAVPGTVVMLHPGLVYLPSHIRKMPNYPWIDKDNTYLMSRYDGCIVDPKGMDTHIEMFDDQQIHHPYAMGHMANHPPVGSKPNIMPFSYDFQQDFPADLLKLVPNRYYREPGILFRTSAILRTVVYVTIDRVCDEELFINYRLNPACKLPEWYTPVDSKEDSRRWSG